MIMITDKRKIFNKENKINSKDKIIDKKIKIIGSDIVEKSKLYDIEYFKKEHGLSWKYNKTQEPIVYPSGKTIALLDR